MRTRLAAVAVLIIVMAPASAAQRASDAVSVDPTHHQVVLEKAHVRIIRALVSPGARSPMHTHPPLVLVSLGTARARMTSPDGKNSMLDLFPGQVLWGDAVEHSWQMVAGQAHVVGVEVKAAARGTPPSPMTLPATDAVTVDPVVHQVILENPYVRVIEALSSAGRRSPMHTHSRGTALISFGRARLNLTPQDGNTVVVDLHPGQVIWLEPGAHSWEVIAGASNLVSVEVKSATARP